MKNKLSINNNEISYKQFIDLLKSENKDFLEVFIKALKNAKTELNSAFFWECLPISRETTERTFEFVVTKSASLENINQNYSSFQEHITKNTNLHVLSFPNLPPIDAILIVPKPLSGKDYKNISNFTENAPIEQQQKLWKEVVEKLTQKLDQDPKVPKWLSTHGLGVYYLHVRVNDGPIHYHWHEYKNFEKFKEETPPPQNPKQKQPPNKDNEFPWTKIAMFGLTFAVVTILAGLVIKKNRKTKNK